MESKESKINYICDGKMEGCKKTICYMNGGDCRHTKDIRYAKNFYKPYKGANYWEKESLQDVKKNLRMLKVATICTIASAALVLISISVLCILH